MPKTNLIAGKGNARVVIIDIIGRDGFVPGARMVFDGRSNDPDYHSEMDGESFRRWVRSAVLENPHIPDGDVLVLDNAPYHSVKVR